MWIVTTIWDEKIEAPFLEFRRDRVCLKNTVRVKISYEEKSWLWWMKPKTFTEYRDERWAFFIIPLDKVKTMRWDDSQKELKDSWSLKELNNLKVQTLAKE